MSYTLDLTQNTLKTIEQLKKAGNKPALKKIQNLFGELIEHPYEGTGQPEALKHELSGYWSRRINREHRIIYSVNEEIKTVTVISAKGHYS